MANAKEILIRGTLPYDCHTNQKMIPWLAAFNGPSYGLRIKYSDPPSFKDNPATGGKIAMYDFTIQGLESVAWIALDDLASSIKGCGGTVTEKKVYEL